MSNLFGNTVFSPSLSGLFLLSSFYTRVHKKVGFTQLLGNFEAVQMLDMFCSLPWEVESDINAREHNGKVGRDFKRGLL